MRAFGRFAWTVLAYHLAVVAWGGFVRATGSGAGCGKHWPTCNGEVVPRAPRLETAIEFTHRATSGIAAVFVVALLAWAYRAFPRRHPVRRAATASAVFLVTEALLGAALVLFGWVAKDASVARGWAMPLHLANTFLLLAALALTAWWSGHEAGLSRRGGAVPLLVVLGAVATVVAGITGAIAALGDTLFPARTFAEGFRQELGEQAHVLLRLRVLHPFAAIVAGGVLAVLARAAVRARSAPEVRRAAVALAALVALQVAAGLVNLALLAPVWMQIVHLVLADLTWVALVVVAAASLAPGETATADATVPLAAGARGA